MVKNVAKMSGIPATLKVVNHSTRRTYITRLYRAGVDPILIAQLSGHRDLGSLLSYTEASEDQQGKNVRFDPNQTRCRRAR